MSNLNLGVARTNINPPLTLTHAGWGAQTHIMAEGIESDFWSTVLVLSEGETVAVIVDLDTCILQPEQADDLRTRLARSLGIGSAAIRISTTHTHAGPLLSRDYYDDRKHIRLAYLDNLMEQTVGAALQARREAVPVIAGAGYGQCRVAINRRQRIDERTMVCGVNEGGTMDPAVGVLRFEDESGATVASIVQYAMHPTLLGPDNRLESPDYPGVVKRTVESIVGGTCVFLQGAAGDVGPGKSGFVAKVPEMRRIGKLVGCAAAEALLETSAWEQTDRFAGVLESGASLGIWSQALLAPKDSSLQVAVRTIQFPVSAPMPPAEAENIAASYRQRLNELQTQGGTEAQIRDAAFRLKRAELSAKRSRLFHGVRSMDVEAHFIRVGDTVLIGMPIEPFSGIGIAIRERSPFACTLFGGYTNGWLGYLPTSESYADGGYEVETSPFAQGSAELLITEVVEQLERMKQEQ
jgi:hypothetical protein